jgi:hypothetical protein
MKRTIAQKVKPRYTLEKKKELKDLPLALWIYTGQFLEENDFLNTFLNRYFARITLRWIKNFYKNRYQYFPLHSIDDREFKFDFLEKLNRERKLYKKLYYSLFNPAFIELFLLVEQRKSKEAQAFIESMLSKLAGDINVTDIVFSEKNADGLTVINIAGNSGLQDFLTYCFNRLVLNGQQLNQRKPCLVRAGNYSEILSKLDSDMSGEVLWMYGCAYVCNQTKICDALSKKPEWDKIWNESWESESLLVIAALLGSIDLARFVTDAFNPGEIGDRFDSEIDESRMPSAQDPLYLDDVISLSKNKEMIQEFGQLESDMLLFYIERRDLTGLRNCYDKDKARYLENLYCKTVLTNSYYNINSDQILLPIGAAIAKNWLQGVQFILESGFSLHKEINADSGEFFPNSLSLAIDFGRTGIARYLLEKKADPNGFQDPCNKQSAPIFHAIEKNNLEVVKLLVESKASLDIENKARETPRYPLVSAALNGNPEITQYLLQNISTPTALQQLWNVSSFFKSRSPRARALLAEIYDELNPFREANHAS